jgi:putative transposase
MEDELHKLSTRLVEELHERGVATVVIGDITGIRDRIDYGTDMNRRLHQWAFRQFTEKVEYKAERYGMTVTQTGEAYTSQACPECSYRSRQNRSGREFSCCRCGCEAHADVVGAMNIRAKYLHPDEWEAGTVQAVRATASESDDSKGSVSSRKPQMSLFGGNSAAVWTRATHRVQYDPHMTCVVSEG